MDAIRNPFAPGAGAPPPELVGRDSILKDVDIALRRAALGRPSQSYMMLGLRGTGKTVLLNQIVKTAETAAGLSVWSAKIEAPEGGDLAKQLYPKLTQVLRRLSAVEAAKAAAHAGMRALRSFAATLNLEYGGLSLSVDPELGTADSGDLAMDLSDLFVALGRSAKAAGGVFVLLIDEVQYLNLDELSALITALHECAQKTLPVVFIGAGLPQVAGLAGDAKSYAERLFQYPPIGPLPEPEARRALVDPIVEEGEAIEAPALESIISVTKGYPYFLQEWGYHAWNISQNSPISVRDAEQASIAALKRLDNGFFKVRMDRLTISERDYVYAMASLPGDGPYRSGDIASVLGKKTNSLGPRRSSIIKKGMIYSPDHGDTAFTVPGFADYLRRTGYGTEE